MFSANSGSIAKAMNEKASIDGHEMNILVRELGPRLTIENLKNVVERELQKKPKGGSA